MLASGVLWSANDNIIYSPIRDRSPCSKPLLNFEVDYPTKDRYVRRLATYQPTAYLLVDHRPSTLNNSLSVDTLLANLKFCPATVSTSILLS
eukprot:3251559-Pleurochrysis_carterae.AAC.1